MAKAYCSGLLNIRFWNSVCRLLLWQCLQAIHLDPVTAVPPFILLLLSLKAL